MVFISIRLFLLLLLCNGFCCFQETRVLNIYKHHVKNWKQKHSGGVTPSCHIHKSRKANGATILEMKHRDHCSVERSISDWNKKIKKRLIMDDARVRSLQLHIKTKDSGVSSISFEGGSSSEIPITSGVAFGTLNYIVQVGIGGQNQTVIVDTGSDLTWFQCQPCKLCYDQKDPLFNPAMSPSYQPLPCNSSTCQSLALGYSRFCGTAQPASCNYVVSYGDGSYTRGDIGLERIDLGTAQVDKFLFGCGRINKGLYGGVSGLMGLGKGKVSLITQTSETFGGVFSYCLPAAESEKSGSLVLGENSSAYKNSTPISYAEMITNPQLPGFYFLNLAGVSIGAVALRVGARRIIIDSGTIITRLPPSVYKVVKEEFVKQFSGFPTAPGYSILDTCFNLSAYQEVEVPTVKIHLDVNGEMVVDVSGVFYFVEVDASQVCLAMASLQNENEIAIIGNYQQKNQRVIYYTKDSKLGFAGEECNFL